MLRVRCPGCGVVVAECACGDHARTRCDDCGATVDLRDAERVVEPADGQATLDALEGGEA